MCAGAPVIPAPRMLRLRPRPAPCYLIWAVCTLAVVHRAHATLPLVVAANRDEFFARPATPPAVLEDAPRIVAGRDLLGGGSWLGATGRGFFVGLTNQRSAAGSPSGARSRGHVVLDALRAGSVAATDALLAALDPTEYGGFNLLYGDAHALHVAYARPDASTVEIAPLPPGVHVLANDRLGSASMPKALRAAARIEGWLERPWPALRDALAELLADDSIPPLEAVPAPPPDAPFDRAFAQRLQALCVRTPSYGTRCADLLAIDAGGVHAHLHAEGPPGDVPFEDVSALYR